MHNIMYMYSLLFSTHASEGGHGDCKRIARVRNCLNSAQFSPMYPGSTLGRRMYFLLLEIFNNSNKNYILAVFSAAYGVNT